MTAGLVQACAARALAGDVLVVHDETLRLEIQDGALSQATSSESGGSAVRVFANGKAGWAGATTGAAGAEDLVDAAIAAADAGEVVDVHLPQVSPLPEVATADEDTATTPLHDLGRLGVGLATRLAGEGRRVDVSVERALGSVAVANTRGVDASFDTTLAAFGVRVEARLGDAIVVLQDVLAGAAIPGEAAFEALVAGIDRRLEWASRPATPPAGQGPVLLMPRAVRAVLRPVMQALLAGDYAPGSPLAGAVGEQRFAPAVHLTDDPLLPGRPGSRPIDDDGVVTQQQPLVVAGVVNRLLYDVMAGARLGRPSTGSARRTLFGPSRPGFSNLVMHPGSCATSDLHVALGDGLIVEEVAGGAGTVASGGAFRFPVASALRVQAGEVVGRVEGVAISGHAFDMLARVQDVGAEQAWVGSAFLPPLLVEGIEVGAR